jgi:hypothetical protein
MPNETARRMRVFVARENIRRFDEVLARDPSSQDRAQIESLLAEEKRSLDDLNHHNNVPQANPDTAPDGPASTHHSLKDG